MSVSHTRRANSQQPNVSRDSLPSRISVEIWLVGHMEHANGVTYEKRTFQQRYVSRGPSEPSNELSAVDLVGPQNFAWLQSVLFLIMEECIACILGFSMQCSEPEHPKIVLQKFHEAGVRKHKSPQKVTQRRDTRALRSSAEEHV